MPELPEVEVTRLGVSPHIKGLKITNAIVHDGRLRWPVPKNLKKILLGQMVHDVRRRGKYLLFVLDDGHLLIHLGMTGVLRVIDVAEPPKPHDRVEILFGDVALRLNDPRKFGAVLWVPFSDGEIENHPLLAKLGVEPLSKEFSETRAPQVLYSHARGKTVAVKQWLLSGSAVVGVGNIYCSESLFEAGIHPQMQAGRLTLPKAKRLADAIRAVLRKAIRKGGSSLRDFVNAQGEPGHFMMHTHVYDRAGLPCHVCGSTIKQIVQGQRSTYFCPKCQKK